MGELTDAYAKAVRSLAASLPDHPDLHEFNELLRLAGRWRSRVIANTLIHRHGAQILAGPFAGMTYTTNATEGALCPRLLGTYEAELHPHLAEIGLAGVECVVDVGCAEGYYAVGLARLWPQARVYAYDIDAEARRLCAELAECNGVADRVEVRDMFEPAALQEFAGRRTLLFMDVEGAETELLRPDMAPALGDMDVIVETHGAEALRTIPARFAGTHDVRRVDLGPKTFDPPPWLLELPHLDQLLAVWEWRAIPTPWLVMRPRR